MVARGAVVAWEGGVRAAVALERIQARAELAVSAVAELAAVTVVGRRELVVGELGALRAWRGLRAELALQAELALRAAGAAAASWVRRACQARAVVLGAKVRARGKVGKVGKVGWLSRAAAAPRRPWGEFRVRAA